MIEGIDFGQLGDFPFGGLGLSGVFSIDELDGMTLDGVPGTPTSAHMPYLDDWVVYQREVCEEHIQPAGAWRCNPGPGFNEGPAGVNPQPYILWDYQESVCPAGTYDECLSILAWQAYAASQALLLRVEVQERFEEVQLFNFDFSGDDDGPQGPSIGFNYVISHFLDPEIPMYRVLPFPCSGDRTYRARLVLVEPGSHYDGDPPTIGPWSSGVFGVLCRQPVGEKIWLEATFHSVNLDNVEDCDLSCEETVEVTGYFHAMPGGPNGTRPIGHLLLGYCSGEKDDSAFAIELDLCAPDFEYSLTDGAFLLHEHLLCFSDVLVPGFECDAPPANFVRDNNKIYFQVLEGEAVELKASVHDVDSHSGDDTVCSARVWTPPRSLDEWAAVDGDVYLLSQSFAENDNADCRVDVTLRAVAGPPAGWGP
jgi:hypothetical protein